MRDELYERAKSYVEACDRFTESCAELERYAVDHDGVIAYAHKMPCPPDIEREYNRLSGITGTEERSRDVTRRWVIAEAAKVFVSGVMEATKHEQ